MSCTLSLLEYVCMCTPQSSVNTISENDLRTKHANTLSYNSKINTTSS